MDHHASHGLRYITNPPGNPVRVHQHLKIGDGDVDWDEFFGGLAEIGFYDRADTVMVSSVFAENENAHEVSRYQLRHHADPTSPNTRNRPYFRERLPYDEHDHTLDQQQGLPRHRRQHGVGHQPGHRQITGEVALANVADARAVIDAAAAAFPAWRDTSLAKRTAILFAFRELLNARKGELAEIITAEHGKVVSDALGEVTRGQEVVEFACGIPHLLKGGFTENASTKVDVYSIRQPLGPVGIISPFNFPAMVPMWFFPSPSPPATPSCSSRRRRTRRRRCGWPSCGRKPACPRACSTCSTVTRPRWTSCWTNPAIKAVSFVGSTPIARYVYETGTTHGKRVQALGGAKNHAIVLPDADLDLAADAMVDAGFGSAGERCMAISAVVAVGDIADELVAKIAERARTIKTGDGTRDADMGPLVTKAHRDKVASYVDAGEAAGATLVVDGRTVDPDGGERRILVRPHPDRPRHPRHVHVHRRDLRSRAGRGAGRELRRSPRTDQRESLRQRHRHLHQRRRRGTAVPERGRGRHGRHQRPHPRPHGLLQLRRLEELPVR